MIEHRVSFNGFFVAINFVKGFLNGFEKQTKKQRPKKKIWLVTIKRKRQHACATLKNYFQLILHKL